MKKRMLRGTTTTAAGTAMARDRPTTTSPRRTTADGGFNERERERERIRKETADFGEREREGSDLLRRRYTILVRSGEEGAIHRISATDDRIEEGEEAKTRPPLL